MKRGNTAFQTSPYHVRDLTIEPLYNSACLYMEMGPTWEAEIRGKWDNIFDIKIDD